MAKVSLNKLGLSKNQDFVEFNIGENIIQVLKYLDIAQKSTLVNAAVRGSVINGVVDEILVDAYLHIFILENYTNISLTAKQKESILDTFDIIESNGLFDSIIANMNPDEYNYIFSMAKKLMQNVNEYNKNIISLLQDPKLKLTELLSKIPGQTE